MNFRCAAGSRKTRPKTAHRKEVVDHHEMMSLRGFDFRDVKLSAIRARGNARNPFEQAAKKSWIFIAHVPADLIHWYPCSLEPPLRLFYAQPLNVIDGRVPGGALEAPFEAALRNARDARSLLDGIGHGEVVRKPVLRLMNRGIAVIGNRLEYGVG